MKKHTLKNKLKRLGSELLTNENGYLYFIYKDHKVEVMSSTIEDEVSDTFSIPVGVQDSITGKQDYIFFPNFKRTIDYINCTC